MENLTSFANVARVQNTQYVMEAIKTRPSVLKNMSRLQTLLWVFVGATGQKQLFATARSKEWEYECNCEKIRTI